MRKFASHLPCNLWDAYESWASGRGKIQNRQLTVALFRLFLAAPERVKMLALYGPTEDLEAQLQRDAEVLAKTIVEATGADAVKQRQKSGRRKGPVKAG